MPEVKRLDLDLIQCDAEIQTREVLDSELLELMRELYREDGPDALPPVVVFHDADDVFWLADGHYRFTVAREALNTEGQSALPAEVYEGTKRDAAFYAAGANAKHGKPLSYDEKRAVVQRLLNDSEWSKRSDRQIARHTGTSHVFVGSIRKQLEIEAASGSDYQIPAPTRTVHRGGTTYQMHTGSIGHAQSVPAAAPSKEDDDDEMEHIVTEGLNRLMHAWNGASHAARRAFREWVLARPIEDYGEVSTSEQTKRYNAVIAEVCSTRTDDV